MSSKVQDMKNRANALASQIMGSNCYIIIVYLVSIIFLVILTYSIYFRRESTKKTRSLEQMQKNKEKFEKNNNLPTITALEKIDYVKKTPEHGFSYSLIDYYVFGSFNSCCQGDVINGYVSLEALKNVISYGVRLLDFELYFKDGKVVVAAGRNNVYIKDTYNHIDIGTVLSEVKRLAIRGGAGNNNSSDPLLLNFRIVSNNPNIYHILENKIMKYFSDYLADRRFGKEGNITDDGSQKQDRNIFFTNFNNLRGKVIILVDDANKNYLDNPRFYELVNGTTSRSLSLYGNYQVKNENTPDKYRQDAHHKFLLSKPDVMENVNSSWKIHHSNGIQGVLMNFGGNYFDDNMKTYISKFSKSRKAFILKDNYLQRIRTAAKLPTKQDENLNPAGAPVVMQIGNVSVEPKDSSGKTREAPFGGNHG